MERIEQTLARVTESPVDFQNEALTDVQINSLDVLADMLSFPALYLKWAAMLALVEEHEKCLKNQVATSKAEADSRWRLISSQGAKLTEAGLAAKVATDGEVLKAQEQHLTALNLQNKLRAVVDSLAYKKDMLQSVNSRQCREFVPSIPK